MRNTIVGIAAAVAVACGGSKPQPTGPEPGSDHTEAGEGDEPEVGGGGAAAAGPADAGVAAGGRVVAPAPPPDAGPSPSPYTFQIENTGTSELVFALDKGWQTALFAYSGKPPKAKSVLLFPTWCTESCEAAADKMCPVCKEPVEPKDIKKWEKAETKREIVAAGGTFKLDWDGKVYVYEKAPKEAAKKKKKCQCWRKADPPAETYTVKACGLRPQKEAGKASKPVCAETQVTLPSAAPTTISLTFADPPPPPAKGKGK